jgi:hypothetical protein
MRLLHGSCDQSHETCVRVDVRDLIADQLLLTIFVVASTGRYAVKRCSTTKRSAHALEEAAGSLNEMLANMRVLALMQGFELPLARTHHLCDNRRHN